MNEVDGPLTSGVRKTQLVDVVLDITTGADAVGMIPRLLERIRLNG